MSKSVNGQPGDELNSGQKVARGRFLLIFFFFD